ncbi:MAG TPA: M48 family metalloprotease, partial [Thermoanaerobaculia bacterium]
MTTTPPEAPKLPIRPATPPATVPGFSPSTPSRATPAPTPARAAAPPSAIKSVKPADHVVAGTGAWVVVGVFALLASFFFLALATWGIGLLVMWAGAVLTRRKLSGTLRGGALRVGPKQFPEIHERVTALAAAMGIKKLPEVYILESNTQNAFAMKHGKKSRIVLVDDMVFGSALTGNDNVLTWILAHELAHIALGHTGAI